MDAGIYAERLEKLRRQATAGAIILAHLGIEKDPHFSGGVWGTVAAWAVMTGKPRGEAALAIAGAARAIADKVIRRFGNGSVCILQVNAIVKMMEEDND